MGSFQNPKLILNHYLVTSGQGSFLMFPKGTGPSKFCKDFWDCYYEKAKIGKIGAFPVTIPETLAGRIPAPVPFSFFKSQFRSRVFKYFSGVPIK